MIPHLKSLMRSIVSFLAIQYRGMNSSSPICYDMTTTTSTPLRFAALSGSKWINHWGHVMSATWRAADSSKTVPGNNHSKKVLKRYALWHSPEATVALHLPQKHVIINCVRWWQDEGKQMRWAGGGGDGSGSVLPISTYYSWIFFICVSTSVRNERWINSSETSCPIPPKNSKL